jgi:hypothetical protein
LAQLLSASLNAFAAFLIARDCALGVNLIIISLYQILLFNNIFDDSNNTLNYQKKNMFWFEEDFYFKNSSNFEYYFIDIAPNLLFLDINTISNKALYYLCYTYIFFNKTHENIDLLNIINSNLKNNIFDEIDKLYDLEDISKYYKINTPFKYLINSYFQINQEKFYNQKNYFENSINIKNIFTNNTHRITINPINKWRFISSIGIKEYNHDKYNDAYFIDTRYIAFNESDYDEIHIKVNEETQYEKYANKLIFENIEDIIYYYIDPLSYDEEYDDDEDESAYRIKKKSSK